MSRDRTYNNWYIIFYQYIESSHAIVCTMIGTTYFNIILNLVTNYILELQSLLVTATQYTEIPYGHSLLPFIIKLLKLFLDSLLNLIALFYLDFNHLFN